jgi:hypothetical protein
MLGSSSCGTVLIRASMSIMIQILECEVQLKDPFRMYSYIYDARRKEGRKASFGRGGNTMPGPVSQEIPDPGIS